MHRKWVLVEPDHAALEQIMALIEAGSLWVEVGAVYPLGQAAEAHKIGETGRTQGKIVLSITP